MNPALYAVGSRVRDWTRWGSSSAPSRSTPRSRHRPSPDRRLQRAIVEHRHRSRSGFSIALRVVADADRRRNVISDSRIRCSDRLLEAVPEIGDEAARKAAFVGLQARLPGDLRSMPGGTVVAVSRSVVGPSIRAVAESERFWDVLTCAAETGEPVLASRTAVDAEVAKLADAASFRTRARKGVWVQVLPGTTSPPSRPAVTHRHTAQGKLVYAYVEGV